MKMILLEHYLCVINNLRILHSKLKSTSNIATR